MNLIICINVVIKFHLCLNYLSILLVMTIEQSNLIDAKLNQDSSTKQGEIRAEVS